MLPSSRGSADRSGTLQSTVKGGGDPAFTAAHKDAPSAKAVALFKTGFMRMLTLIEI